jgi:hypothetical protein
VARNFYGIAIEKFSEALNSDPNNKEVALKEDRKEGEGGRRREGEKDREGRRREGGRWTEKEEGKGRRKKEGEGRTGPKEKEAEGVLQMLLSMALTWILMIEDSYKREKEGEGGRKE